MFFFLISDNSITLLHYIVRAYIRNCGDTPITDIPLPVPEPSDIDRASNVDFEDIESQINKLKKDLGGNNNNSILILYVIY